MHFTSKRLVWTLHVSILKEPYGAHFLTALEYDGCLNTTRWHLKCLQEGTLGEYSRVINSGVVGGKL